jgi:hypothetical protein
VITFVQVVLLVGALCGGGLAFDLLEKGNNAGGIGSGVLAVIGLGVVVALELLVKK